MVVGWLIDVCQVANRWLLVFVSMPPLTRVVAVHNYNSGSSLTKAVKAVSK